MLYSNRPSINVSSHDLLVVLKPKYGFNCLPGKFSGLNLVCLEYVAFKQFALEMDIGFDLSAEYHLEQAPLAKKTREVKKKFPKSEILTN